MTDLEAPPAVLFLLRQSLLLGPVALILVLAHRLMPLSRIHLGALFSFFYALPLVFVCHVVAVEIGVWSYQGNALKILGFPADIWFGGALLWGPALLLAFPRLNPWWPTMLVIALNTALMPLLAPFLILGEDWFLAMLIVFLIAHTPALFLGRWTAEERNLPLRAALLAVCYGAFAFFTLPTVVMHAMGGSWMPLLDRSPIALGLAIICLGACFVVGMNAVQMFALHGGGTPIPLDPTKRLVRTGVYAYIRNPMQACTALAWLIMGLVLQNIWVALSSVMAVAFVLGMVRWHHRQDLEVRFPAGWAEYKANVPEWWPRWRPWVRQPATLVVNGGSSMHRQFGRWLTRQRCNGLDIREGMSGTKYHSYDEQFAYTGVPGLLKSLEHLSLPYAIVAAGLLLLWLPIAYALNGFHTKVPDAQ